MGPEGQYFIQWKGESALFQAKWQGRSTRFHFNGARKSEWWKINRQQNRHSKAVVLLLLTFCLLLLPLWESVIVLCFVVRYFMSILVLQSSWWGRESWLLCLICLPGVSWWLSGSSSRCNGVVCGLWLWCFPSSPAKVSSYLPFDKPFASRPSKFIISAG